MAKPAASSVAAGGGGQPEMITERAFLALDQIIPNPRNPRRHPEEQVQGIGASLKHFGQTRPILLRKENRMIVAGHGTWEGARAIALDGLWVELWDVDQATADEYMLADNEHAKRAHDDRDRIAELLSEIDRENWQAVGIAEDEGDKLLASLDGADDAVEVVEIETTTVRDRFWISVRGPLVDQARALQRLQEVMAEFPGVEVQLGTIADG